MRHCLRNAARPKCSTSSAAPSANTILPPVPAGAVAAGRRHESGDKLTRFGPFSSQCRAGNVRILRAPWNEDLFRVLEGFPDLAHDDEVDACSGALEMLNPQMKGWGQYELMRRRAGGETLEQIAGHAPTTPEAEKTPSLLDIYLAERKKHDGV